jgi:hypothetical protein
MITYAKVGEGQWHDYSVIDLEMQEEICDVVEVNTLKGWVIILSRDEDGKLVPDGDDVKTEKIAGNYLIFKKANKY